MPSLSKEDATIAVAPGSVWETKQYPVLYFKQVVEILLRNNLRVALIGGKEDYSLCEKLNIAPGKRTFNLAGVLSISQSITFLKKCRCILSNDSAPTHMGVAANIPVITIYCSTIPKFGFYPYNNDSCSISFEGLKCKPCGIHGHKSCPENSFDCGYKLKPEVIIDKLRTIIADIELT